MAPGLQLDSVIENSQGTPDIYIYIYVYIYISRGSCLDVHFTEWCLQFSADLAIAPESPAQVGQCPESRCYCIRS